MNAATASVASISVERKISALARCARAIFTGIGMQDNCCVAATRLGIDFLTAWGVKARPLYTEAAATNADKSYAVTVDTDSVGKGLSGHLVIFGKAGSQKFLLDLSAYQMHRPARRIIIESGVVIAVRRPLVGSWQLGVDLPMGGRAFYRNHPRAAEREWERCGDWRLPTDEHRKAHYETLAHAARVIEEELRRGA